MTLQRRDVPARRRETPNVTVVTQARESRGEQVRNRQLRYAVTMGFRTVCLLLATFLPIAGVFRFLLIVGAVILPFFAVVYANGREEREVEAPAAVRDALDRRALPPTSSATYDPSEPAA